MLSPITNPILTLLNIMGLLTLVYKKEDFKLRTQIFFYSCPLVPSLWKMLLSATPPHIAFSGASIMLIHNPHEHNFVSWVRATQLGTGWFLHVYTFRTICWTQWTLQLRIYICKKVRSSSEIHLQMFLHAAHWGLRYLKVLFQFWVGIFFRPVSLFCVFVIPA